MIYFAQTPTGSIKIGHTGNIEARLDDHRYGLGELSLLATMPGGYDEERGIHARFAHLRFPGTEQFRPGPDLMAFIGKPLLVSIDPDAIEAAVPRTMSIKLPMDVIESARIVSAYRGETMTELMGDILRPALARMEQEEMAKRTQSLPKRKGAK